MGNLMIGMIATNVVTWRFTGMNWMTGTTWRTGLILINRMTFMTRVTSLFSGYFLKNTF